MMDHRTYVRWRHMAVNQKYEIPISSKSIDVAEN